ncbi:MAG: arginine--tRNA ligase [Lachnospiraceae bacterium]|nr:arginine--tRNA ligase [Lachnospiraceae bacterium]
MKQISECIESQVQAAFEKAGYDPALGRVKLSDRPDLCEYQSNGAMAGAKLYHKAPIMIAEHVAAVLKETGESEDGGGMFESVEAVKPGFLNLKLSRQFVSDYVRDMGLDERLGADPVSPGKKIIIDYGGANVAKPLHVGHLRSAVIGESIKRILRFAGHDVIGDVHLGDWGLQMGLIITEVKHRNPDLPYFDPSYDGEYPEEAPFTISELEEIYPAASSRSKEDEAYKAEAMQATYELQHGNRGYLALWNHILDVSITDLKKNYGNLNVEFDLWKKESDAQPYIPDMVQEMKDRGYAHLDQGALVVDVKEETDTKEIPPCMILKSDGSSLYNTTDLATLVMRRQLYDPDEVVYVVDKRQELYFTQVFRAARKTGIVKPETELEFLGFGTMNGRDGKPFKTRSGGVMRLENLIAEINEEMYRKIMENHEADPDEARETAKIVALSAIKYGDLSNQASKDYIFDTDKFTSFEGNTGPYILYTIVRIKSILGRFVQDGGDLSGCRMQVSASESEKALELVLTRFAEAVSSAASDLAPHKLCAYIYELANAFNHFYHETKILTHPDQAQKESWIALLDITRRVLETSIDLLGFDAPERM